MGIDAAAAWPVVTAWPSWSNRPRWSSNQAGAASGVERGAARFFTDVIYDYREASVPPNYMASLTPVGLELARLDQVRTVWNMLPGWHTRQP